MSASVVAVGSIAFVGPIQVPSLSESRYVRVVSTDGESVCVRLIDPVGDGAEAGGAEDEFIDPIDCCILRQCLVSSVEKYLWPGSFVGRPIAFVQPDGPNVDTWTFGIATGYKMYGHKARLHLRFRGGSCKITLQQPSNAIQVDWINYVLQTGAGSDSNAMSAIELRARFEKVCQLCDANRSGVLPAKITSDLSRPYNPTEHVPIIRPDTLAVMIAPRQHVLACAMNKKGRKNNMFNPPARKIPLRKTSSQLGPSWNHFKLRSAAAD